MQPLYNFRGNHRVRTGEGKDGGDCEILVSSRIVLLQRFGVERLHDIIVRTLISLIDIQILFPLKIPKIRPRK